MNHEPTTQPPTEEELRVFVGVSADYYIPRWKPLIEQWSKRPLSFNWAAFLFGAGWMLYRRMWKSAAIIIVVQLLIAFVLRASPLLVFISLACGFTGNRWYYNHAKRKYDELATTLSGDELLDSFEKSGGTSMVPFALYLVYLFCYLFYILYSTLASLIK